MAYQWLIYIFVRIYICVHVCVRVCARVHVQISSRAVCARSRAVGEALHVCMYILRIYLYIHTDACIDRQMYNIQTHMCVGM